MLIANLPGAEYQWLNCDSGYSAIQGATNQTFYMESNGSYAVVVWQGQCNDTSECIVVQYLGIDDNFIDFSLFPNPSNGGVNVNMNHAGIDAYQIQIVDKAGRKVGQFTVHNGENQVQIDLPSGVYYLIIGNRQKKLMITE